VFAAEKPEVVVHHAAHIEVARSVREPAYDASINILGSLNLMECCREYGVRKIIYAGTAGRWWASPSISLWTKPIPSTRWPPTASASTRWSTTFHLQGQPRHRLHRPSLSQCLRTAAGPARRGRRGRDLLPDDAARTASHHLRDGTKTRDYCYVGDIAAANVLALNSPVNGVYNLGRGIEVTDLEVFEAVRTAVGSDMAPQFAPVRPGEVEHIALDAAKAKRELGWTWKVDFADG